MFSAPRALAEMVVIRVGKPKHESTLSGTRQRELEQASGALGRRRYGCGGSARRMRRRQRRGVLRLRRQTAKGRHAPRRRARPVLGHRPRPARRPGQRERLPHHRPRPRHPHRAGPQGQHRRRRLATSWQALEGPQDLALHRSPRAPRSTTAPRSPPTTWCGRCAACATPPPARPDCPASRPRPHHGRRQRHRRPGLRLRQRRTAPAHPPDRRSSSRRAPPTRTWPRRPARARSSSTGTGAATPACVRNEHWHGGQVYLDAIEVTHVREPAGDGQRAARPGRSTSPPTPVRSPPVPPKPRRTSRSSGAPTTWRCRS